MLKTKRFRFEIVIVCRIIGVGGHFICYSSTSAGLERSADFTLFRYDPYAISFTCYVKLCFNIEIVILEALLQTVQFIACNRIRNTLHIDLSKYWPLKTILICLFCFFCAKASFLLWVIS
jgi:hypothetical protein